MITLALLLVITLFVMFIAVTMINNSRICNMVHFL